MYSITQEEARDIAKIVVEQSPYAPIDYLIQSALKGLYGKEIIEILECSDEYSEEYEDAVNVSYAIEYYVRELLEK